MFLGIDIGSTTSKAVIMDTNAVIMGCSVIDCGTGTTGPETALNTALKEAGLTIADIQCSVATGYGRMTFWKADKQITEISCHAKGIQYLAPGVKTIIDIGGQDAKVIQLDDNGRVISFAMNDKCAAGTGRFLEVVARILDSPIDQLGNLAKEATGEVTISNTCTVFAESEIISQLASGAKRENVAKGAHRSIAKKIAGMLGRIEVAPAVAMTGGVALNSDVVKCLEEEIKETIIIPSNPQIIGAIGAAIFAAAAEKNY